MEIRDSNIKSARLFKNLSAVRIHKNFYLRNSAKARTAFQDHQDNSNPAHSTSVTIPSFQLNRKPPANKEFQVYYFNSIVIFSNILVRVKIGKVLTHHHHSAFQLILMKKIE